MLSDCKKGDWIIFKSPSSDIRHIGIVLEEPNVSSNWYKLLFHATVDETNTYIKPEEYLQGCWSAKNRFILPFKPTMEEIFKIKQIQEKE